VKRILMVALIAAATLPSSAQDTVRKAARADLDRCQAVLEKDSKNPFIAEHLSDADRSELEFCRIAETLNDVDVQIVMPGQSAKDTTFWRSFRRAALPLWFDALEVFCQFHPSAPFVDVFGNVEHCSKDATPDFLLPSREELEKVFTRVEVISTNFLTFLNSQNAAALLNAQTAAKPKKQ
jgi:hypothetical protein